MDDELLLPCEKNGCDMAAIGVMRSSGSIVSMRSIHPMVNDDDGYGYGYGCCLLVSGEARRSDPILPRQTDTLLLLLLPSSLSLSLSLACV